MKEKLDQISKIINFALGKLVSISQATGTKSFTHIHIFLLVEQTGVLTRSLEEKLHASVMLLGLLLGGPLEDM